MGKPNYINKKIKHVNPDHLKKVLRELNEKHRQQRREDRDAINKALSDGFRCGPRT